MLPGISKTLYRFLLPISFCLLIPGPSLSAAAHKTTRISLPVVFEENHGQVESEFRFLNRSNGMETLYASSGIHMRIPGKTGRVTLPVEVWMHGPVWKFHYGSTDKVTMVSVDPDGKYPDSDRSNNVWKAQ